MNQDEQKQYLKVMTDLNGAIARDYPEYVPNLFIIDPTKPLKDEIKRAEKHLNLPNLQARVDRQLANLGDEFVGIAFTFRRGDVNDTDPLFDPYTKPENPFFAPDEIPFGHDDVVLILPLGLNHKLLDASFGNRISILLHEVAHGLHMLDPNFINTFPTTDGKVHYQSLRQRVETFAETFAYELGVSSGLLNERNVNESLINRDLQIGSPIAMQYNANEEVALLRANGGMQAAASYTGFPNLREAYDRSMKAQNANFDFKTMNALYDFNSNLPPMMGLMVSGQVQGLNSNPQWNQAYETLLNAMPFGARVIGATNASPDKPYVAAAVETPDLLKTSAKIWMANKYREDTGPAVDFIDDAEAKILLSNALKQYNAQQASNGKPQIDTKAMQRVIDGVENKVWAEELLRGTPIIEALQKGLNSIETTEPVPAQQAGSGKPLQR